MLAAPVVAAAVLAVAPVALGVTNYANDFVAPKTILQAGFDQTTISAQQTIIQWANSLNVLTTAAVVNKDFLAPSGDKHDYMSWRPYFWPDCTNAGNTTELPYSEVFKQCEFKNEDGNLNPNARLINNIGDFDDMANAVWFNALSWGITRSSTYSKRAIAYLNTWFLDPETKMNPNLNYAQMMGGKDGQVGSHTGILDLKPMAKLASGILLFRDGNAEGWNSTIDGDLQAWVKEYIGWITTNKIALEEKDAPNNHGSFYYTQLASLHLIVGDNDAAAATAKEYFEGKFKNQIAVNGDQPEESARTRPYHYLAYNLAAIITTGRIAEYAGANFWNSTATSGAGIEKAAEFAMAYPPGEDKADELFPVIAAVASIFGDPEGKYAAWLNDKSQGKYVADASFLWNQPLSDSGNAKGSYVTYAGPGGTNTLSAGASPTGGTAAKGANPSATLIAMTSAAGTKASFPWAFYVCAWLFSLGASASALLL
ncbi:hypothetical protein VHUM_03053 [Vanrija humicola]|uniref:Alginate lyase domain-containing protein n=1 Tax=Vanrija humicola TaxID=5417 RepID=A0A7D8UZ87_VANHU|nr:hypothetical protein VHUM_03053 [Vanrija humicola]